MTVLHRPELLGIPADELRGLVRLYYDVQKYRKVAAQRRLITDRTQFAFDELLALERHIRREIARSGVLDHPIWTDWLVGVKGVGPTLTAGLLAAGIDIERCDKPSRLWRFAGVGMTPVRNEAGEVVGARAQRLRRGAKRDYNGFLGFVLENIMSSILKRGPEGSLYSELYYRFKAEDMARRPGLEPIHYHRRALLRVKRVFLAHLLEVWRAAEGLPPPRRPYAFATDGAHEYIPVPWARQPA